MWVRTFEKQWVRDTARLCGRVTQWNQIRSGRIRLGVIRLGWIAEFAVQGVAGICGKRPVGEKMIGDEGY